MLLPAGQDARPTHPDLPREDVVHPHFSADVYLTRGLAERGGIVVGERDGDVGAAADVDDAIAKLKLRPAKVANLLLVIAPISRISNFSNG